MELLEYASEVFIVITLYLLSDKFLIPVLFVPLSNNLKHRFKSLGVHREGISKRRRRRKSAKSSLSVKRLSSSYIVVTDSSTTLLIKSPPSVSTTLKKRSPRSATHAKKTPRSQSSKVKRNGDHSSRRIGMNSLLHVLHRISPKYIYSKVRRCDMTGGKPLPLRIIQLKRGLF